MKPETIGNKVDLPQHEGPSRAMSSPAASSSCTSLRPRKSPKRWLMRSRRKSCPRASLETPNSRDVDLIIAGWVGANSAGTGSGPDNNGQVLSPRVDYSDAGNLKESL